MLIVAFHCCVDVKAIEGAHTGRALSIDDLQIRCQKAAEVVLGGDITAEWSRAADDPEGLFAPLPDLGG